MGEYVGQLLIVAFVVGVSLTASAMAQAAKEGSASTTNCVGSDPDVADPKARELVCLRELGDRVSRKGNVLSLKLDDGRTKVFKSNPKACENDDASHCERYYLVGFHPPSGRYLVYATFYENSDCAMVSARTGKVTSFRDVPHFAPDGQTFFVTGVDGAYDNWIGVGSMASDPPALQWEQVAEQYVFWNFVRWVGNDRIELSTHKEDESCSDGNCDAVLTRTRAGWALERQPPKPK
jgi:hypothetical protein